MSWKTQKKRSHSLCRRKFDVKGKIFSADWKVCGRDRAASARGLLRMIDGDGDTGEKDLSAAGLVWSGLVCAWAMWSAARYSPGRSTAAAIRSRSTCYWFRPARSPSPQPTAPLIAERSTQVALCPPPLRAVLSIDDATVRITKSSLLRQTAVPLKHLRRISVCVCNVERGAPIDVHEIITQHNDAFGSITRNAVNEQDVSWKKRSSAKVSSHL